MDWTGGVFVSKQATKLKSTEKEIKDEQKERNKKRVDDWKKKKVKK